MKKDYEIIGEFDCSQEHYLVVSIKGNIHIMTEEELKVWYGRLHQERWDKVA